MKKQKYVKIKFLRDALSKKKGEIARVEIDEKGSPVTVFWRRRFRDNETEKYFEIVKEKKTKSTKPEPEKKPED